MVEICALLTDTEADHMAATGIKHVTYPWQDGSNRSPCSQTCWWMVWRMISVNRNEDDKYRLCVPAWSVWFCTALLFLTSFSVLVWCYGKCALALFLQLNLTIDTSLVWNQESHYLKIRLETESNANVMLTSSDPKWKIFNIKIWTVNELSCNNTSSSLLPTQALSHL